MNDPSIDETRELAYRKNLEFIYPEICRSHQAIAEFRGKLLALLPIASGAGIFLLLNSSTPECGDLIAIGLFGSVVTLGLLLYDLRGIQDCITLRERGEHIEKELRMHVDHSHFRAWPRPALWGLTSEVGAGWLVYTAVMASWLYVAGSGTDAWKQSGAVILPALYMFALVLYWILRLRRL